MSITPLYVGLLALCYFVLSIRVIGGRRSGKVSLSDGGDAALLRRIRAHGNFAEYVPLVLVLMLLLLLLESTSTPPWLLHAIGTTLLIGRLLHAYALSFTEQFMLGRVVGTMLTFIALVTSAVLYLWRGIVLL